VGVDEHSVVPGGPHRARLRKGGRDVNVVTPAAERAVYQDPHLLDVIDDENPRVS
jgi:hypothetical protein